MEINKEEIDVICRLIDLAKNGNWAPPFTKKQVKVLKKLKEKIGYEPGSC